MGCYEGCPSSLTEVKLRSAGDLGNFYPIPCMAPAGPEATQSPPEELTVEYKQSKTETLRPTAGDLDKYIDWDTDNVQDRSHTPSSTAVIDEPMQVSPQKKHCPQGRIYASCQSVSLNLGRYCPRNTHQ